VLSGTASKGCLSTWVHVQSGAGSRGCLLISSDLRSSLCSWCISCCESMWCHVYGSLRVAGLSSSTCLVSLCGGGTSSKLPRAPQCVRRSSRWVLLHSDLCHCDSIHIHTRYFLYLLEWYQEAVLAVKWLRAGERCGVHVYIYIYIYIHAHIHIRWSETSCHALLIVSIHAYRGAKPPFEL